MSDDSLSCADGSGFCIRRVPNLKIVLTPRSPGTANTTLPFEMQGPSGAVTALDQGTRNSSVLSPMAVVTVPADHRELVGIPKDADFFSFAYPLSLSKGLTDDLIEAAAMEESEEGTHHHEAYTQSWLDFVLIGGFCYFDKDRNFLSGNALSAGDGNSHHNFGRLNLQGPLSGSKEAGRALEQAGRMQKVTVPALTLLGFTAFAWVNPSESPGGQPLGLRDGITLENGGFVYEAPERNQLFVYRMSLPGDPPLAAPSGEASDVSPGGATLSKKMGGAAASVASQSLSSAVAAGAALDVALRGSLTQLGTTLRKGAQLATGKATSLFVFFNVWGQPTRGESEGDAMRPSPPDATCSERWRDSWFKLCIRHQNLLFFIAMLSTTVFVCDLIMIVILWMELNLGVKLGSMSEWVVPDCNISLYNESAILFRGDIQYPPRTTAPGMKQLSGEEIGLGGYVAMRCNDVQLWFNICVKYTSYYFLYINGLPIPWTLATFYHVFYPKNAAASKEGHDFYGRKSRSLWFHIPIKDRKWISGLMLFALIVQVPDAISHMYYYTYLMMNTFPGAVVTNVWLVVQLTAQISASVIQSKAETKVRQKHPKKFPPILSSYLFAARKRWLAETKNNRYRCSLWWCGEQSFYKFVKLELEQYKAESAKFGKVDMLTGIEHSEVGAKPSAFTMRNVLMANKLSKSMGKKSMEGGLKADYPACTTTSTTSVSAPMRVSAETMSAEEGASAVDGVKVEIKVE